MSYAAMNIIPLPDLARLALRDHPGAGDCLYSRLNEAQENWAGFTPFDRKAITSACARALIPGEAEARDNVVAI